MPDEQVPKPSTDQIVTPAVLQQAQYAAWRSTSAFGGVRDPSQIWAMMVRQDSYAIPLYRELEDKDDDISAALSELKLSVLEREWTITPGDDSQVALDAAAEMESQFKNIDLDSAFDAMLDAPGYGFTVSELMFDASNGQARLIGVDDCPQELFLFGPRFQPQIGNLQLLSSLGAGTGVDVPEEKFLIFSYRGRSRSRMGQPLLMDAFWPSWFKRHVLGLWLKCGEKANGTALARYAASASQAEQDQALEAAEALAEGTAFAIPEDMVIDLDLLKAAQERSPAIYEKLFQQMQYSIARVIKGETLTSFGNEGGKGSHAQGKTHQETFDKRSISLAKKHARVVNTQLLRRLTLWNFGPDVPQPVFAWDTAEEVDLVQKSTLLTNAQALGIPIGAKWAAEQLQIPPLEDGEEALVPNAGVKAVAPPATVFSEADKNRVDADLTEFDTLAAQLKADSVTKFRTRIREVAERLVPSLVK